MEELNPVQQNAVNANDGASLIVAGAGSGKTRVLTYKIAYLIRDLGTLPYRIMALTFTNKAAKEMKERFLSKPSLIIKRTMNMFLKDDFFMYDK